MAGTACQIMQADHSIGINWPLKSAGELLDFNG
jgi:hypothetical protein